MPVKSCAPAHLPRAFSFLPLRPRTTRCCVWVCGFACCGPCVVPVSGLGVSVCAVVFPVARVGGVPVRRFAPRWLCLYHFWPRSPPLSPSPGSGAFLMSGTTQGCLFGSPGGPTALTRAGVGSAWRCGTWLWAWRAKLPRLEPGGGEVYFMRGLVSKQLRKQRKASVRLAEQRAG